MIFSVIFTILSATYVALNKKLKDSSRVGFFVFLLVLNMLVILF